MTRKMLICLLLLSYGCVGRVFANPGILDLVALETKQYAKGGGKAFDNSQQTAHGEAENTGYAGHHVKELGAAGHHDKERHLKQYAEEAGNKKSHSHDDGYYSAGHKADHGENGYHFVDKGSFAKGHNTKGHHNIHKLDEYNKKKEFFDEDHDEAHKENHGAYNLGKAFKNGEFQYGGHAKKVYFEGEFGATGKAQNGGHNLHEAGHKNVKGKDQYFKDAEEFVDRGNEAFFKDFGFRLKGHK